MSCGKSSEILTLHQPTRLSKVIKSVPNFKEASLNFGLPKWKSMPLDAKVPVIPSPEKTYNFSRQKVGQKLRVDLPSQSFTLDDPYNRELDCSYNALHDKHLAKFFSRPNNKKHLIRMGLVGRNMEVQCSPKQFNQHREYWRKMHGKAVKKELKKRDESFQEKKMLELTEDLAEIEMIKLIETERNKRAQEIRKQQEANRLKSLKEKQRQKNRQIDEFMRAKREEFMSRKSDMQEQMIHVKRTQDLAKRIEKCRQLMILRARRDKERKRMKEKELRIAEAKNRKIIEISEKWKKKEELQKASMEKEQQILLCMQKKREQNIQRYNEEIQKKREMDQRNYKLLKNPSLKSHSKKLRKPSKCKSESINSGKTSGSEADENRGSPRKPVKLKPNRPRKVKGKKKHVPKILKLFSLVNDDQMSGDKECICYAQKSRISNNC